MTCYTGWRTEEGIFTLVDLDLQLLRGLDIAGFVDQTLLQVLHAPGRDGTGANARATSYRVTCCTRSPSVPPVELPPVDRQGN
jgi:hypothetical protein